MHVYEIEQYEIHTQSYWVTADSEAQAIVGLFNGRGKPLGDSLEFIELSEDLGLSVEEYHDLAEELRTAGFPLREDVIPSIHSIAQVE